jgi:hypothetical protein
MRHLKLFERFDDSNKSLSESIDSICQKFGITNWTVDSDGGVDVDGNVNLGSMRLTKIPLKFGRVSGDFYCDWNELTTLEGCPHEVGGSFICADNYLTGLEGCPSRVGGDFNCIWNKLTTLEDAPEEVGGDFYCRSNSLITLEGSPKDIGGAFYCSDNPINNLYRLFPDYKSYRDSQDYGYLRGTEIVKRRFGEALDEIGIRIPESSPGYKYI